MSYTNDSQNKDTFESEPSSKFPKWIIYFLIAILFGVLKGGIMQCNREKVVHEAIEEFNNNHR